MAEVGKLNSMYVCGCFQGLPAADTSIFIIIIIIVIFVFLLFFFFVSVCLYAIIINVKMFLAQSVEVLCVLGTYW